MLDHPCVESMFLTWFNCWLNFVKYVVILELNIPMKVNMLNLCLVKFWELMWRSLVYSVDVPNLIHKWNDTCITFFFSYIYNYLRNILGTTKSKENIWKWCVVLMLIVWRFVGRRLGKSVAPFIFKLLSFTPSCYYYK